MRRLIFSLAVCGLAAVALSSVGVEPQRLRFGLSSEPVLAGLRALDAGSETVDVTVITSRDGVIPWHVMVSADLRHAAHMRPTDQEGVGQLVVDGEAVGEPFAIARLEGFVGGKAIAYDKNGRVHIDGAPGPVDGEARHFYLSPDGRRFGYVVRHVDKKTREPVGETLVMDGRVAARGSGLGEVVFSPDGSRLAWVRVSVPGEERERRAWVNVDGREAGPFRSAGHIRFSRDSDRCAFVFCSLKSEWGIVLDGQVIARGNNNGPTIMGFDARSRLVYRMLEGSNNVIRIYDRSAKVIKGAAWAWLSPDGEHLAWYAMPGPYKHHMVVDGRPQTRFSALNGEEQPFAPVGSLVAYTAWHDATWRFAVVNGKVVAKSKSFGEPIFSADGQHVAFIGAPNGWTKPGRELFIEGKRAVSAMDLDYTQLSADGRHWVTVARQERDGKRSIYEVHWDGRRFGPYRHRVKPLMMHDGTVAFYAWEADGDAIAQVGDREVYRGRSTMDMCLSPDGRHYAFTTGYGQSEGHGIVVDGKLYAMPERVYGLAFVSNTVVRGHLAGTDGFALVDISVTGESGRTEGGD